MKKLPVFLASFGLLLSFADEAAAAELQPGDAAPDFKLKGSDGKEYRLSDFKGRQAVVLAWFPKAFTSGCTAECKSLRENGEALRNFEAAIFAASCDDADANKRFAESLDLDYPILSDPSREAAEAYGVVTAERRNPMRHTFYIGKDGKLLAVDRSVKTATHGSDVAAKLEEFGVAKRK